MVEISEILSFLSIGTLTKIKNKCEAYNTYCIDYKQVNAKYNVKTRQKDFLELQEMCTQMIALKQFESDQANCTKSGENNNNVTSTMNESQSVPVESKKKEKKNK